ncbi:sialate O-acetylesterase [Spirosoma fluminis]
MVHSFLLVGQSNMSGRGFLNEVPPIYDEHIKMLRNGRWQTMTEPVNYDRPFAGIGLGASFAAAWRLKNGTEEIGLIPAAEGGASLDDWSVGGVLFDHAVFQARLAQRSSQIEGILWHQGENDCFQNRSSRYYEKFAVLVEAFRRELNSPQIPLIVGELGHYIPNGRYGTYFTEFDAVNQALLAFARSQPSCYFVTASGLRANPDELHFNAVSQRRFGIRYFEAYQHRRHVLEPVADETDQLDRIYSRPLSNSEKMTLVENQFASGHLSLEDFERQLASLRES